MNTSLGARWKWMVMAKIIPKRPACGAEATLDIGRRSLKCYGITPRVAGAIFGHRGGGTCSHEVVPVQHQTWFAIGASCAGDPVCAGVRAFPRRERGARYRSAVRRCRTRSVCPAGAAGFRPRHRPASAGRPLRDLRRDRAGKYRVVCNATAVAAAASGGFVIPDDRCRVFASEFGACRIPAPSSPRLLKSIDRSPVDRRVMRGRFEGIVGNRSVARRRQARPGTSMATNPAAASSGSGECRYSQNQFGALREQRR